MIYWTMISFNTIHITCITHLDVAHIPAPDPDFELVVREVPLQLWGPHQGGGDTDIAPWPGPKDRNRVQYRHDPINQLIPYTTQLAYSTSTTHNMQTKSHRKTCHHSHFYKDMESVPFAPTINQLSIAASPINKNQYCISMKLVRNSPCECVFPNSWSLSQCTPALCQPFKCHGVADMFCVF